jgi:hypothetical protein
MHRTISLLCYAGIALTLLLSTNVLVQFNHAGYTFTLNLRDNASQASGDLTFSGFFSGSLTGNNANIKNTFTSPTTQTLTVSGNTYTVTMGTYTPPGPPGAVNAGNLNALVR